MYDDGGEPFRILYDCGLPTHFWSVGRQGVGTVVRLSILVAYFDRTCGI